MGTFKSIYSKLETSLNNEGINISRFQVLFILYFENEANANTLSKKLLVTRGNISMLIKRMEGDGLIVFEPIFGKKRHNIKLSKKGKILFEDLFPRHIGRVKKLVNPLYNKSINELIGLKTHADNQII
jgi:DNA-binding MarR family transcriptional regulator